MGKVTYTRNEFMVIEDSRGHVIINMNGQYHNHGHIKKASTCKMLIGLIHREIVPNSPYLRKTCLRICLDDKYIAKIKNKIKKDRNKQRYFNPSKGVIRK